MAFKSYTSCVQPQDYQNPPGELATGLADLALLRIAPGILGPVIMFEIEELLDYLLNGKLVCLGGDRCAVGQVIGFETPQDKSFPDSVDNDFSINLMLSPNTLGDFLDSTNRSLTLDEAYKVALKGKQCTLIDDSLPPDFGLPYDPEGNERYVPYSKDHSVSIEDAYTIGGWNTFFPLTAPINVPVLHLECEGSRIHDLLKTLQDIGGLGTGICDIKVLGIPIGKAVCAVIATVLSPIVAAALAIAWAKAQDGNAEDPRAGGLPGELKPGNMVVVTGRWVYDAGHQGWNELHPVKSIQKIAESIDGFGASGDPKEMIDRWCSLVIQVPPPNREGPGGVPSSMTPAQQETWDSQLQPENRWYLHPLLDGCEPSDQPNKPPVIK